MMLTEPDQRNKLNKPNRPDFILRKLEYYRDGGSEKHLTDIANMVAISSNQINFEQLQNKIKDYALEKEWQKAQKLINK